jgi:heme-degrading monooxygenase HmoA
MSLREVGVLLRERSAASRKAVTDSSETNFDPMIFEHAVLDVVAGEAEHFEETFRSARPIISSMPGCRSVRLERCIESRFRYLLLVEWDSLEDHTVGFRGSDEYQQWRRLLHHFYDPFPTVEHYEQVGVS